MSLNNMGLGFVFTAKDLASGVMGQVKDSFNEVEGASKGTKAAFAGAFKQFGVGVGIMGAGLAGFAMLAPAVEESGKLSKAIADIATEADLAIFPQEKMRDIAEDLGVKFGLLPVDEAKAMYKAVAMGANDATKATNLLTGASLLADAGGSDLETTMQALGGTLNAYGKDFNQATDVSDIFFTAMKDGNMKVGDLAASIGRITSSAAGLNIPLDQVTGAVAVMTNKGVAAAEAVSGLKEALANVVHPSADAKAEAARLGIKFNQAEVRAKGLAGFLHEITSSSKYTAESMSKLFTSVEGSNAIVQITSNNMSAFDGVMKDMGTRAGATQKGFDIMNETLDMQEKKFSASKAVALGMIGQAIEPMAIAFMKLVNGVLKAFTQIPKPIVTFLAKMFLVVSTVLTVVGAAIAAKAAFVMLLIGLKAVGITIGGVVAIALPLIIALGLIALAAYGMKVALDNNVGGIRDLFDKVYKAVSLTVRGLGQLFSQGGFSGEVRDEMNAAGNGAIKTFVVDLFVWIKRIGHLFEMIGDGFKEGIKAAEPAIELFKVSLDRLMQSIGMATMTEGPDAAKASWKQYGDIGAKIGNGLAKVFEFLVNVISAIIDISRGVVDEWKDTGKAVDGLWGAFSALGTKIGEVFAQFSVGGRAIDDNKSGWTQLGTVIGVVAGFIVFLVSLVVAAFSILVSVVSGVVGAVKSVFSGIWDMLAGFGAILEGIVNGDWAQVWFGFKLIVFGIFDALTGIVLEFVGVLAGAVDSVAGIFGKDLGAQKAIQDFKNSTHNSMAKDFGVTSVTGYRQIQTSSELPAGVAPGGGPPLLSPPGTTPSNIPLSGGGVASLNLPPGIGGPVDTRPINVNVVLDGEVLANAQARTSKKEADRSFSPSPIRT